MASTYTVNNVIKNKYIDENVYLSEKKWGNKNRALAYLLKSYGMLDDDVEEVMEYLNGIGLRL